MKRGRSDSPHRHKEHKEDAKRCNISASLWVLCVFVAKGKPCPPHHRHNASACPARQVATTGSSSRTATAELIQEPSGCCRPNKSLASSSAQFNPLFPVFESRLSNFGLVR